VIFTIFAAAALSGTTCVPRSGQSKADWRACAAQELAALDHELAVEVAEAARNTAKNGAIAAKANHCNFGSDSRFTLSAYEQLRRDLLAGQRAFLRYREMQCRFEGAANVGGTAQGDTVALCKIAMTQERIARLRAVDVDPQHIDTTCVPKSHSRH